MTVIYTEGGGKVYKLDTTFETNVKGTVMYAIVNNEGRPVAMADRATGEEIVQALAISPEHGETLALLQLLDLTLGKLQNAVRHRLTVTTEALRKASS